MSLPPLRLRPVSTSHFFTSGDVMIQEGAAIAPGVLIQADPDSRIVIQAGVCIGLGSILHAYQGLLEVGKGANIGAEVLLIGQVKIGANACIGSATTVFNSAIAPGQVIPPGSLIGDPSRQVKAQETQTQSFKATEPTVKPLGDISQKQNSQGLPEVLAPEMLPTASTPEVSGLNQPEKSQENSGVNVYGQMYVNQMLVKLFPNSRQSLDPLPQPDKSATPDDPWDD